jgi:hypothetical protein
MGLCRSPFIAVPITAWLDETKMETQERKLWNPIYSKEAAPPFLRPIVWTGAVVHTIDCQVTVTVTQKRGDKTRYIIM